MGCFSDVLLTVDFDRTLTAADSTIPARNVAAIEAFIREGGAFTVNTGRSLPMFQKYIAQVPVNVPLLLYNGAVHYDTASKSFTELHAITLPQARTLERIAQLSDGLLVEVQGAQAHYVLSPNENWEGLCKLSDCPARVMRPDEDVGPFLKVCVYILRARATVDSLFHADPAQVAQLDRVETALRAEFGENVTVFRVAPRTIDIVAPGCSKGKAALELKRKLGRRILVCVGDEKNDLSMLEAADFAFAPAGSAIGERFPNVCTCDEGAVADVIEKQIPAILARG